MQTPRRSLLAECRGGQRDGKGELPRTRMSQVAECRGGQRGGEGELKLGEMKGELKLLEEVARAGRDGHGTEDIEMLHGGRLVP